MSELISSKKSAFVWKIDGVVMKLGFNTKINQEEYLQHIEKYKEMLRLEKYKEDKALVNKLFLYFGGLPFVRIGMEAFHQEFILMCRCYIREYLAEWEENIEQPSEQIPSFTNVLERMTGLGYGKCISCFGMVGKYTRHHKDELSTLMQEEFADFWGEKIISAFAVGKGVEEIRQKLSVRRLTKYCMKYAPEQTKYLIGELAESYTIGREVISLNGMAAKLFGNGLRNDYKPERWDKEFARLIYGAAEREMEIQKKRFIPENHMELDVRKDCWKIYKCHGGNLALTRLDYRAINSNSLRLEVKHYMCYRLKYGREAKFNFVSNVAHALNVLTEKNPNIKFISDIGNTDAKALHMYLETEYITPHGNKLASATIGNIFACCSCLVEYLMSDKRNKEIRSPRPYHNPFSKFKFVNLDDYKKNTAIIPETVVEQLDKCVGELKEHHELLYRIFSNTGMRLKEALFLEADCIEESRYDNLVQIKYKPYKVLTARRKEGLEDYHRVLVPAALSDRIKEYMQKTEELRSSSGLPYIFLGDRYHGKINMTSMGAFINAINALIARKRICDDFGNIWHFTTRQCRKTIAVTLIENGATTAELSYWLGHLTASTSMRYYAEVRKMKLAQLNTEFFRKKFELVLEKSQLEPYTEEERKLLYIDFRLEQRKVEFGFCMKKLSDGGCTERNSIYNCVNCRHLCTGRKYLPYWQELLESQKTVQEQMERAYHQEGIEDYSEFKEYRQIRFLLECYQNVVDAILESEGTR